MDKFLIRTNSLNDLEQGGTKRKKEEKEEDITGEMQRKEAFMEILLELKREMGNMRNEMQEVNRELKEIKKDKVEWKAEVEEIKKILKNNETMWQNKEMKWKEEKEELKKEIENLANVVEQKERREIKNNVILKGLVEEQGGSPEEIETVLKNAIRSNVSVIDSYRLGKRVDGGKPRPVLIKMRSWRDKRELFMRRRMFKNTNMFIDDDLTVTERQTQNKIKVEALKMVKENEKFRMGYKKVQINNEWWFWNNETNRLEKK